LPFKAVIEAFTDFNPVCASFKESDPASTASLNCWIPLPPPLYDINCLFKESAVIAAVSSAAYPSY